MTKWFLFALFLIVGLGMLVVGIVYMRREKQDAESVRIYRAAAIIGALLTIGAILWQVLA